MDADGHFMAIEEIHTDQIAKQFQRHQQSNIGWVLREEQSKRKAEFNAFIKKGS